MKHRITKKQLVIFLLMTIIVSCGSLLELLELKVDNDLTENIDINIPQTAGVTETFSLSKSIDLRSGDLADYSAKITDIKINSFTYKFKDFTGNTAGIIPQGAIKIDNLLVESFTNLNVSQAVNAETIFTISDRVVLNQLENTFLNASATTIVLEGNALTDAGPINFITEFKIKLTATIRE